MPESLSNRRPTAIRTADVLDCFGDAPVSLAVVAQQLGVARPALSGHIGHLQKQGKIERVSRGQYRRTEWGFKCQGQAA